MKKDIFSVWIKEFCTLVFTQSVQAFLLSIIMSIILTTAEGNSSATADINVSATGIIAIVALVSISKVELLVKKIFGIESQFGDPSMKSGAAGLAGTLIGAKLAGRVLNNAGKVGSGIGDVLGASKLKAKANAGLAKGLNKLKGNGAGVGAGTMGTGAPGAPGLGDPSTIAASNLANSATTGALAGATAGATSGAIQGNAGNPNATLNINPNTLNINAGNVNVDGKDAPTDKVEALREKYDDAIEKAKAQRRQGIYKAISGVSETGGALTGATAGAIYGLAQGDGVLQKAGVGMGMGDYVGEKAVSTVQAAHDITLNINDTSTARQNAVAATRELTGKDITKYRSSVKELEKYTSRLNEINKEASNKIDAGNAE